MGIEKTIQSLNNNIWYRFIKVLYILCFWFISSIALFFSYEAYKPKKIFDNEKSYIQCTATEGASYGLALNGVYLRSDYISSDNDKKFSQWCSTIDISGKQYTLEELLSEKRRRQEAIGEESKPTTHQRKNGLPEGFEIETQPSAGLTDLQRALQAGGKIVSVDHDPFAPPYKLVSHYKTEGTWYNFAIASIVSIMTIFLIFETGRRIFYYIILGSLFPQKEA